MTKNLSFTILFSLFSCLAYAQPTVIITTLTAGSTIVNGVNSVPYCSSQTYFASVFTQGPLTNVCNVQWYDQNGTILGAGNTLTRIISGNIQIHARAIVGYADCSTTQPVNSSTVSIVTVAPSITGPIQVCTSPVTYTLNNLPANPTISWTVSSNLQIVGSSSSSTVQVQKTATGTGTGTVTATINSACSGTMPAVSYSMTVGPRTPTTIAGMYNGKSLASHGTYDFSSSGTDWLVSGGTITSGQGTTTIEVLTATNNSNVPYNFAINVRENDACGVSSFLTETGYVIKGAPQPPLVLSPNPTSGLVTLSTAPAAATTVEKLESAGTTRRTETANIKAPNPLTRNMPAAIRLIRIYDVAGRLSKSIDTRSASLPIQLDVSDLVNGLYFVEIVTGNDVGKYTLIVHH